ncbi:hypothetical protein HGRIS_012258 [Hohenbuehelia grisea]|uniref:F-box domain-containing protein n=1 Tax=Hohenbuehelia grisea TaxID=104357 RepID=A0ABR3IRP5_9AGAR
MKSEATTQGIEVCSRSFNGDEFAYAIVVPVDGSMSELDCTNPVVLLCRAPVFFWELNQRRLPPFPFPFNASAFAPRSPLLWNSLRISRSLMQAVSDPTMDVLGATLQLVSPSGVVETQSAPQGQDDLAATNEATVYDYVQDDDEPDGVVITNIGDKFSERAARVPRIAPPPLISSSEPVYDEQQPLQFPTSLPPEISSNIFLLALPPVPDLRSYWTIALDQIVATGVTPDFCVYYANIALVCRQWKDVLEAQLPIFPVPHVHMNPAARAKLLDFIDNSEGNFAMTLPLDLRSMPVNLQVLDEMPDIMRASWPRLLSFVLQHSFNFEDPVAMEEVFGYKAPVLRRLYLTGSIKTSTDEIPRPGIQTIPCSIFNGHAPQLRELVLEHCVVCPATPFVRHLTHLSIRWINNSSQGAVYKMLEQAKQVEHLDLLWALAPLSNTESAAVLPHGILRLPALRCLRIGDDGKLNGIFGLFRRLKAPSNIIIEVLWSHLDLENDDVEAVRRDLKHAFLNWRKEMERHEVRGIQEPDGGVLHICDTANYDVYASSSF